MRGGGPPSGLRFVSPYLTAERADVSYAEIARELRIEAEAVRKLLHQLRRRLRELLRDEVSATIDHAAELEDELRYLCAVLATRDE